MLACPTCGEQSRDGARFCHACGAALASASPAEVRKVVTVVFCDVIDSTKLGEKLDAESLRRVMTRYFDEMRTTVERHGGTVEKFIGDAVMAVFGVPTLHEDDALRAVRAAVEMRERLTCLNEELETVWGVRLATRIGINTGEVVAGDPAGGRALVTGDAVNLAKRLEQEAAPGTILIGNATFRLTAAAVDAEALEPIHVKGKAAAVTPWRVERVRAGAEAIPRPLDAPMVGRTGELLALLDDFERAADEGTCRIATVLGPAGIGKSRLARELVTTLDGRAATLIGRCLPYGEGITFWPVAEMVHAAGGEAGLRAALAGDDDADLVVERVLAATGAAREGGEETFWAIRKAVEALAAERPLVLGFDDVHWAEPTLLELIDYLGGRIGGAAVLIVCLGRPEVLERDPRALAPRPNARVIVLEPLPNGDVELMLSRLAAEAGLSMRAQRRVAEAAEGNPLFVEQMVAMLAEQGEGETASIPPSIQALLSARLDRLSSDERDVIERAAVIGKEFWPGALRDLVPPALRPELDRHLTALVRKELVRSAPPAFGRDEGFRFRHVLIRDAAYERIPKRRRAELHERFADWIVEHAGEGYGELEEIVGYHLEQAYRLQEQLGRLDDAASRLAARAADVLASAGRRASARSDLPAAINLLGRALDLGSADQPARPLLLRELSAALWAAGRHDRAEATLSDALTAAVAAGDRRLEWYARLEGALRKSLTAIHAATELDRVATEAVDVFEELGDDLGLARAWRARARVARVRCRFAEVERAAERALAYAEAAGDSNETAQILDLLFTALLYGPARADRASARCRELTAGACGTPFLDANAASSRAGLEAMLGNFEEARALVDRAATTYDELGQRLFRAGLSEVAGPIELLAGRPEAAERELRHAFEILAEGGDTALLGYPALMLAETLLVGERDEEARYFAEIGKAAISPDDTTDQILARMVDALLRARESDHVCAETEARRAVASATRTDALALHADALVRLGEVLLVAGRASEARAALEDAVELYERKGHVVGARRARASLAAAAGERAPAT